MPTTLWHAFGLDWRSDRPLTEFARAQQLLTHWDVDVRRVEQLPDRPGGRVVNHGMVYPDGTRFQFGTTLFDTHGDDCVTWCDPSADAVPAAFYGTVCAIILAWRGLVPLHGSAVEHDGAAILIAGPSGAGKSTLCDALTRRGCRLVSDDLSALLPLVSGSRPALLPGRPAIRLGTVGEKALHRRPMVPASDPVPLRALALLGETPIAPGPIAATAALTRQLFRPIWMSELPLRRQRAATLFLAAQQIAMLTLPGAADRQDLSADAKADLLLERIARRQPVNQPV